MSRKRRTSESAALNIFFPRTAIRVCILYVLFIESAETTLQREDAKGKGNVGGREKRYTVSHLQQQHFYSLFTMILLESFVTCQGIELCVALKGVCVSIMCLCVRYLYQLLRDI